jgi:hypothetical protein
VENTIVLGDNSGIVSIYTIKAYDSACMVSFLQAPVGVSISPTADGILSVVDIVVFICSACIEEGCPLGL